MFEKYASMRLLRVFLNAPRKEIHVREAAKLAKVSPGSAKKYLDVFYRKKLLKRRRQANLLLYRGNLENPAFRQMKVAYSIWKITECGLVDHIVSEIAPSSITLFGSVAHGEDDETSDLDILVIGKKKTVDLTKFERALGRKINLILFDPKTWREKAKEDRPFYESVVFGGLPLHGELPVV
jgi:predicted nucleotidyltransferase